MMRYVVICMSSFLGHRSASNIDVKKIIVGGSFIFCLLLFGPHFSAVVDVHVGPGSAHGVEGDVQGGTSSGINDTPSEQDIADFAAEFDQDGDGEIDEPAEDEEDIGDEDAADEDDGGGLDDSDDQDSSDDQDRADREDFYLDDEKILENEDEDIAHTGKNRDDIDRDASPDYRLSGYDRYIAEGRLRRLGGLEELTPLIEREEKMILDQ